MRRGQVFVLSGPPGVGKTSVRERVLAALPDLVYSVSLTTRPPRPGEVDGKDYHFVTRRQFEEKIARGEMAEYAEIFGNLYGTSAAVLRRTLEQGRDVFLDIDVDGARGVHWFFKQAVLIFLLPPSLEELERRLRARRTESEEEIQRRLARVRYELGRAEGYTHLVLNEQLDQAVQDVLCIIRAERLRTERTLAEHRRRLGIEPLVS